MPTWKAVSTWVQRHLSIENLILLHFILCSGGLLRLVALVGESSARQLFTLPPVSFNEWSLRFVFPEKPADLLTYLFAMCALPSYYGAAYLLLQHHTAQTYRFFANLGEKRRLLWAYLALLTGGNLLVVFFEHFFRSTSIPFFQIGLWLCLFLAPWYLGLTKSPRLKRIGGPLRRSSLEG